MPAINRPTPPHTISLSICIRSAHGRQLATDASTAQLPVGQFPAKIKVQYADRAFTFDLANVRNDDEGELMFVEYRRSQLWRTDEPTLLIIFND